MLQAKLLSRASGMLKGKVRPEGDTVSYGGKKYQLPENWRETPIMKVGGYRTTANGYATEYVVLLGGKEVKTSYGNAWCFDDSWVVA